MEYIQLARQSMGMPGINVSGNTKVEKCYHIVAFPYTLSLGKSHF